MNKKIQRQNYILNNLKQNSSTTIHELASGLKVSEMTIRRDLLSLKRENRVKLLHGGVILNSPGTIESIDSKYTLITAETRNSAEKRRIGQKAASLIEPHDIIIIDTGSTTENLSRCLSGDLPMTILCYTLNNLNEICKKKSCKLIFAGGYFHENSLMFESPQGVDLIKKNRANKAFLSAAGVSDKLGVTCSNHYEIETKRAAMASSQIRILLADSTKFGQVRSAYFADLSDFDIVITDTGLPPDYAALIEELGISLLLV